MSSHIKAHFLFPGNSELDKIDCKLIDFYSEHGCSI